MEKRLAPRLRKTILLSVVVAISMTSGIGSEINIQGFGALSVFAQNQVSYVSPNLPGQWQLQWSDEFNGSSLSSDWQVGYTNGWLKDVDQGDVSASNVNVSDGLLHLGVSGDVSSFKVSAIGSTTNYSLGYFEARMKMVSGNGHWPIFWLTQGISNEEADVVEYLGNAPNSYYATFHIGEREVGQVHYSDGDLSANYHVYGLYLGPTDQRFYFDGQEIYRMAAG